MKFNCIYTRLMGDSTPCYNFLILGSLLVYFLLTVGCRKESDDSSNLSDKPLAYCGGGYLTSTGSGACYWHDTIQVTLPCPGKEPTVTAMIVDKGVVYCGGTYRNSTGRKKACYWTDTTFHDIVNNTTETEWVTCLAVSEGVVYLAGSYYDGYASNPCYWKGDERVSLNWDHDCLGYAVKSMTIEAGIVYTCVSQGNAPHFYWSGANQVKISDEGGMLNCIRVSGGKIYCAGYESHFSNLYSTTGAPTPFPCYWENKPLPNRTNLSAYEEASGNIFCSTPRGKILFAGTRRTPLVQGGVQNGCYWDGASRTDVFDAYSLEAIDIVDGVVMYVAKYVNGKMYYSYWNGTSWNPLVGEKSYTYVVNCFAFRN
jgi:hypothetical protein